MLFSSDTIHGNPDGATVTFMRSYPNRIPLSAAVVAAARCRASRVCSSSGCTTTSAAAPSVTPTRPMQRSAERYASWVRGDFDELT